MDKSEIDPTVLKQLHKLEQKYEAMGQDLSSYLDGLLHGMEPSQFLQFRMSLLPASGFQSAQYRLIEIGATDLSQWWSFEDRPEVIDETDLETLYKHVY